MRSARAATQLLPALKVRLVKLQVIAGGVVSTTVTVLVLRVVLPEVSEVLRTTLVAPNGNNAPADGDWVMVTELQLSTATK